MKQVFLLVALFSICSISAMEQQGSDRPAERNNPRSTSNIVGNAAFFYGFPALSASGLAALVMSDNVPISIKRIAAIMFLWGLQGYSVGSKEVRASNFHDQSIFKIYPWHIPGLLGLVALAVGNVAWFDQLKK